MMVKKWWVMMMAVVLLSSCKMYQEVKVSNVENVAFSDLTSEKMEAQISFTIENPNWYDIKLKESKIDVYLEGKYLGTIDQFEEILIPKKSSSTQVMRMTMAPSALSDLLGNALALFFKSELKMEAKGYVSGKALFIKKRIDVNLSEPIKKEDLGL